MKREYLIIMYEIKKKIDKNLEKELGQILKQHKFKLVGHGYDTTNNRIDIEYRR